MRPYPGADHNVVIVGGGQSGLAIAYGLRRKGVGRVDVIERAPPGEAGIWRNVARMRQLRTPKTLIGPELGNSSLGVRAWYETLHGPAAFDRLDRISRVDWADYLVWFEKTTGTQVRYQTRLLEIEPAGDLLRLHLDVNGERRSETTRKLVLANGYAGAAGPTCPGSFAICRRKCGRIRPRRLASMRWLARSLVFSVRARLRSMQPRRRSSTARLKCICIVAAPSSTTRAGVNPAPASPPLDRGIANFNELFYELPDEVRWRSHLARRRRVASVPLDSIERAVAFKNFHLHLNSGWDETAVVGGKVVAKVNGKKHRFDHVIRRPATPSICRRNRSWRVSIVVTF